jgi:hypothetical protein
MTGEVVVTFVGAAVVTFGDIVAVTFVTATVDIGVGEAVVLLEVWEKHTFGKIRNKFKPIKNRRIFPRVDFILNQRRKKKYQTKARLFFFRIFDRERGLIAF